MAVDVILDYGATGRLEWRPGDSTTLEVYGGPPPVGDVGAEVQQALAAPLEFPRLSAALVPGDRVVLALDRGIPQLGEVLRAVWQVLAEAGIQPQDLLLLQPASLMRREHVDPRGCLPAEIRAAVSWKIHDPATEHSTGYLATSLAGDRVYLAREVLDADFVLPIGRMAYDPVVGYRGAASVFYPGLSNPQAFARAHGQGHSELRPEDDRPLRHLVDEAAWLLGVQFGVQVVPAAGRGVASVLAGSMESTFREGRRQLDAGWRISRTERSETVVAAVTPADGVTSWEDVGAAIEAARGLVTRGGRIILLTDLKDLPGPGLEMVRGRQSPADALQPLRREAPPDLVLATQWAQAADWASIYLLSGLESDLVEDLFAIPLEHEREVGRLLEGTEDGLVIGSAQYVHSEIIDP